MEPVIRLKNQTYYSFPEFAQNIYLYPDESMALVKSQKFLKTLYNYNQNMYNEIADLLCAPFQQDALLFKVQYILNPLMGIRHHGYAFPDFVSLGRKILSYGPNTDIYLKDFLKYHLLSYYMEKTKYDRKEPALYQKILLLENEYLSNENRAYFKLGFLLEGSHEIFYNDKRFSRPADFLSYVMLPVNITDFASSFIKSQYAFAWLEVLGYQRQITLFENLVSSVEQKEKKNDNLRKV